MVIDDYQLVQRRFANAGSRYHDAAFVQANIAERLVAHLDGIRLSPQTVADIGCGSGFVTAQAQQRFVNARIIAVDYASTMCRQAAQLATAVCGDAHYLPFADGVFDLTLSNLLLQWCDAQTALAEMARITRAEAPCLLATLGPHTLCELRTVALAVDGATRVHDFITPPALAQIMQQAGFADVVVDNEQVVATHPSAADVLATLKAIGATNAHTARRRGLLTPRQLAKLCALYEQMYRRDDGTVPATYDVLYAIGWRRQPASRRSQQTVTFNG